MLLAVFVDQREVVIMSRMSYNQFHSIAKGGIQQTSQGLTKRHGELFSGKGQKRSERNNSDEVQGKLGNGGPVHHTSDDADGDKD